MSERNVLPVVDVVRSNLDSGLTPIVAEPLTLDSEGLQFRSCLSSLTSC